MIAAVALVGVGKAFLVLVGLVGVVVAVFMLVNPKPPSHP